MASGLFSVAYISASCGEFVELCRCLWNREARAATKLSTAEANQSAIALAEQTGGTMGRHVSQGVVGSHDPCELSAPAS